MRQSKIEFQKYPGNQLRNPKFKKHHDKYGKQLEIAYQIAELRKKEDISQIKLAEKNYIASISAL